jgi:hypothetical protein
MPSHETNHSVAGRRARGETDRLYFDNEAGGGMVKQRDKA